MRIKNKFKIISLNLPSTFLNLFLFTLILFLFISQVSAGLTENATATISISVTVAAVTMVDISPDSLTWSNVRPGSSGTGQAIQIENIGSTNITTIWFNNSYPQQLPFGSSDFSLHDAGNYVVLRRNQTNEKWYHPNRVEYNESEVIYLTLPSGYQTHGRFRDGQREYFWALKYGDGGNCTNGTFYIGKQPHNQTQDGTTDLTNCDPSLTDVNGANDCRQGDLTEYNGMWGYADVLVGNNTQYWNYSIAVKDDCTQVIFYHWNLDAPTADYTNFDEALSTSELYPGGKTIVNVNVHIPYGVPLGQRTGTLTVLVQSAP